MTIKQFLKPDWRKIVIFLILLLGLTYLINYISKLYYDIYISPYVGVALYNIIPILGYPSFYFEECHFESGCVYQFDSLNLLLNFVVWYLLSCLIVWIYDKFRKRK
jgi:hypothetical protein